MADNCVLPAADYKLHSEQALLCIMCILLQYIIVRNKEITRV